jgi:hypothetical protein
MKRNNYIITGAIFIVTISIVFFFYNYNHQYSIKINGELNRWHKITFIFQGPKASESGEINPFLDYRLDGTISNEKNVYNVSGYYAADGKASFSSAKEGNTWKLHFMSPDTGTWNYTITFREGKNINIQKLAQVQKIKPAFTSAGSFHISETKVDTGSFLGYGILEKHPSGKFHLPFKDKYFFKVGVNSPENFLAYKDFDQTKSTHAYDNHLKDFNNQGTTWQEKGKEIFGAVNYLHQQGINSMYFIVMNVMGDGNDVWPWTSREERYRYDCSKLDQWNLLFEYLQQKGMVIHFVFNETENECLLDGGYLDIQRKLYYKELVSRFAHHPGLIWNLGEQIGPTSFSPIGLPSRNILLFADHIKNIDPYKHLVFIHTIQTAFQKSNLLNPLLGQANLDGISFFINSRKESINDISRWKQASDNMGNPWIISADEFGPPHKGVIPDNFSSDGHESMIRLFEILINNNIAGVEWNFGSNYPHNDQNCEDFRSRQIFFNKMKNLYTTLLDTSEYIY